MFITDAFNSRVETRMQLTNFVRGSPYYGKCAKIDSWRSWLNLMK
jgi:hypothetical protein